MKFGKVDHPEDLDLSLPPTREVTREVLKNERKQKFKNVRVGCAKWNRKDLKNFYPRGTKDELSYYATQFNSIELNASFYRMFSEERFATWRAKSGEDFQFFPKIPRFISHTKRLKDFENGVDSFVTNLLALKEKLGMVFLQMPGNFLPKDIDRLDSFFGYWPKEIPLGAEFRHPDWYEDESANMALLEVLRSHNIAHIITDSAGRRDLVHMQLTTNTAFIRFNGANYAGDYKRLDEWLDRIEEWHKLGLKNLYFFLHQNVEESSPLLATYFIENFNKEFRMDIKTPKTSKK